MLFAKKIKLDNILVCIGKKNEYKRISIPFMEDLELYFVVDDINTYNIITEKEFRKLNITIEELLEIAKKNVKNKIFNIYKEIPLKINEENQIIIPFDADIIIENGNYNF